MENLNYEKEDENCVARAVDKLMTDYSNGGGLEEDFQAMKPEQRVAQLIRYYSIHQPKRSETKVEVEQEPNFSFAERMRQLCST